MTDEKKEEAKKEEIKLNNDGLPIGQPVTFDQIAKANSDRTKKAKAETEKKAKAKPVKKAD